MSIDDIRRLDTLTLPELEAVLDEHTRKPIPVNEYTAFSWSASRHAMFERCKRQYYLNFYASRRITDRSNHPAISAIWWLKQVSSLTQWIGSVVHLVAGEAVSAHRDGAALAPEALVDRALALYEEGLDASWRGAKVEGRWVALQEHIYPEDEADTDWDVAAQTVAERIGALVDSEAYQTILGLPPEAILEVDPPFQSFFFDDTRVFAIPDVLLEDDEGLHIIDWKTGDAARKAIRAQAGVYALYAHNEYHVPWEAIRVTIVDLARGGVSLEPPGGLPSLEQSEALIRKSIKKMSRAMDKLKYNTAAIVRHPMIDDLSVCRTCNFKRACWRHEMQQYD